jgi:hypothetical protein
MLSKTEQDGSRITTARMVPEILQKVFESNFDSPSLVDRRGKIPPSAWSVGRGLISGARILMLTNGETKASRHYLVTTKL